MSEKRPLADEIRPLTLDEVVGQQHLLGKGALLRRLIESGSSANMIFYGPSGTGKTTIANIIANRTNKTLYRLNATTASLQDVKSIISDVGTMMAPGGILLYLDEIQYFNKKQQQSLLEFMENGSITLIASTTENPYFYVYGALLSRSTVFEFKNVSAEETIPAVERALGILKERSELPLSWEDDVPRVIAQQCGGDVRKAVSACELLYEAADVTNGELLLKSEDALQVAQRSAMRYDKGGDAMYDCASALMKSLRGSDPDAALHYLARFLEAGDLVTPCRRLLCSASEDVGMAYPQAIAIVKACVDTAMQLGLPEAQLPLAQAAVLLATAPKSNSVIEGIGAAWADVKAGKSGNFPRCLQNVHADSTGGAQGQNYKYPHAYPNHWVKQRLPQVDEARELCRALDLVLPLRLQKWAQRTQKCGGLAALGPIELREHGQQLGDHAGVNAAEQRRKITHRIALRRWRRGSRRRRTGRTARGRGRRRAAAGLPHLLRQILRHVHHLRHGVRIGEQGIQFFLPLAHRDALPRFLFFCAVVDAVHNGHALGTFHQVREHCGQLFRVARRGILRRVIERRAAILRGEHLHEPLPVARLQERLRYGRIALELVDELLRAVIHSCASVSCLSRQYMRGTRQLCRRSGEIF